MIIQNDGDRLIHLWKIKNRVIHLWKRKKGKRGGNTHKNARAGKIEGVKFGEEQRKV